MPKCDFYQVCFKMISFVFSCKFAAYFQNTFSQEHLWTADYTNCLKIKLVIYQLALCCCFFEGGGAIVSCLKEAF